MNSHVRNLISLAKEKRIRLRRSRMLFSNRVFPFYWAPSPEFGFVKNFGDELMACVFEFLSGRDFEWNKAGTYDRTLFVGGSVIDEARDGDVIWGAGIRDFNRVLFRENLKVFSVRGPLTRHFLLMRGIECPAVYGDPGILAGELFPEYLQAKKNILRGVVPHYNEYEKTVQRYRDDATTFIIDPRRGAREVVQDIARCEYVASSSLHGIIVAESLGIPVFWWRESEYEPFYKYYDYYLSTQRPGNPIGDLETGFKQLDSQSSDPIDFRGQIAGLKESFGRIGQDYRY